MSIFKKAEEYRGFIDKNSLKIENMDDLITRINLYDKLKNFTLLILLFFFIWTFNTNSDGLAIIIILFFGSMAILMFTVIFYDLREKVKGKVDKLLFENFLSNKVKIYYSKSDLIDFTYNEVQHTSKVLKEPKNKNQAVIELTFEAFSNNIEGLIIVNQGSNTKVSGSIKKRRGSIDSYTEYNAEAILINNIQEKEFKKDLEYWFNLKEKGAITEDEYNKKKQELL